jgi:LysM repeat protein
VKRKKQLFLKEVEVKKEKPKEKIIKHTVKTGENLTVISLRYKTSIERIMKLNSIIKNKDLIKIGWVLKIPDNR